ncbi:hypothetical protein [Ruminococcus gauvreauii]|uniref:hypothetical protein n=1 Tax=Ruminococcus gauvreauii TaxID=438033 RepID=UPI000410E005
MLNSKTKLFTIGQFAALHEINKKTLMWYDEVGLFKPAVLGGEQLQILHVSPKLCAGDNPDAEGVRSFD